ncbi:MAG: RNA polymerase sigma factor [Cyclobacteriaceae bacterium]|nr:RNA polymerase sigma factor [Cyclobacteriaceae bacterium]
MDKDSEQALINQSAKGDAIAFRRLVEDSQNFALSIAYKFLNNMADAEDIVQEAYIRVWKNLHRYDHDFRFKTWLGKIITNLCLDTKKSSYRKMLINPVDVTTTQSASDANETGRQLEHEELKEIIHKLAASLTEKQRAVFILRDLQQLEPDEVCTILAMSAGNLKSNLYYARMKMKNLLEEYYNEKKRLSMDPTH